jgi:hypothetical protein
MKCIPITFYGREVAAASSVMEIEEVLLAIIAYCDKILSTSPSTLFFTLAFYTIALITKKLLKQQNRLYYL